MKTSQILVSAVLSLSLNACIKTPEHHTHIETVKPGAAISLSHTAPSVMKANRFQTIELKIDEAYDLGQMTLEVVPSEGLHLFGGIDSKNFSMDTASTHDWPIDVRAENPGIYFLNIFASARTEIDGLENHRSFSIRLDIGDITPEMRIKAFPENGTLSDDGKTRILEAQETIQ